MKLRALVPSVPEVGREAVIVLAGALLAALVIGQLPGVREWIKKQWAGAQPPGA